MGGLFGGTTISTSDKRINSMRIQQSLMVFVSHWFMGKTVFLQICFGMVILKQLRIQPRPNLVARVVKPKLRIQRIPIQHP